MVEAYFHGVTSAQHFGNPTQGLQDIKRAPAMTYDRVPHRPPTEMKAARMWEVILKKRGAQIRSLIAVLVKVYELMSHIVTCDRIFKVVQR